MLILKGTVLNVIPGVWQKDGQNIAQLDVVIWPNDPEAKAAYTVQFANKFYATPGFEAAIQALKGKSVEVPVSIFSFKNGGYKLNAVDMLREVKLAPAPASQPTARTA